MLDWFIPSAQSFNTGDARKYVNDYLGNIEDIAGSIDFTSVTAPTTTASLAGKATKVKAPKVDARRAGEIALNFNTANAGRFGELADRMNLDAVETRKKMLTSIDPRWEEMRDQADRLNSAMMAGEVSPDIQRNLARTAAFKALQGGFSGSAAASNLSARDLGITSLQLSQQGQQNSMAWRDLLFKIGQPTQILPSDIMSTSGLSADTVASVLGSNADRVLSARTTNATLTQDLNKFNAGQQQNTSQFNAESALRADMFNSTGQFSATELAARLLAGANSDVLGAELGILSADQQSRQGAANAKANAGATLLNTATGFFGALAGGFI